MYLLDASKFTLHYFSEPNIPQYAILSHRWDPVEISFADIQSNKKVQELAGFSKIKGCCTQARLDGWQYAWIDSCCIDKSSSSELSEAINSMFLWYSKAQVCYAYLNDVPARADGPVSGGSYLLDCRADKTKSADSLFDSRIRTSKWFSRGWTLQELLAPEFVTFFSREWKEIGTKRSLKDAISYTTGIRPEYLVGFASFLDASIAERMSWASRRVTSRVEDVAYCLLGLFGVNMPPLYGEGANAFIRLQLEIMRTTNDETLFAWTTDTGEDVAYKGGVLAHSPAAFRYSGNVRASLFDKNRPPFQVTNRGLLMNVVLFSPENDAEDYMESDHFVMILNCSRNDSDDYLSILLQKAEENQYVRVRPEALPSWNREMGRRIGTEEIFLKQSSAVPIVIREDSCTLSLGVMPDIEFFCSQMRDSAIGLWSATPKRLAENELAEFSMKRGQDGHIYLLVDAVYFPQSYSPQPDSRDYFNVIINLSKKPLGANIATRSHSVGSFLSSTWVGPGIKWHTELHRCNFDRLSRPLPSGASVSLTFRTAAAKAASGGPHYIVHISVDATGHLQWPDPQEARATEQKTRYSINDISETTPSLEYMSHALQLSPGLRRVPGMREI
jgi:Heterokaryon incompatibility protein (HET)